MRQEQQIHRLVHRLQFHLFMIIVNQNKTVVLCNQQPTQLTLGRLNAQLLEQGHTEGSQQKVVPTLCLQLSHEPPHLLGHLLWCQPFIHSVTSFIRLFSQLFSLSSAVGSLSSSSSAGSGSVTSAGSGSGAESTSKGSSCTIA